jgi:hypothetical protein
MSFVVVALSVAFAAFCVWLTVRIVNRRERWAKWTAAGLIALIVYALSVGPAIWLVDRKLLSAETVVTIWKPVYWLELSPVTRSAFQSYCLIWVRPQPAGDKWIP